MKIYVASSWRNEYFSAAIARFRAEGFEVYDFTNPPEQTAFQWSEIDPNFETWSVTEQAAALRHPTAVEGYWSDMKALRDAHAVVLVLPCGRSAHLEAGYAVGQGKPVFIWSPLPERPELMYAMTHGLDQDLEKIVSRLYALLRCVDQAHYDQFTGRIGCDA